ncbi:uncharacterized protein LY89DRAFT_118842 [Mollisia scopiformis]|uniref:Uncharacterized protein n=1 Tax=Mollisia scopiformis TaxID=149040 RepID=A0A194X3C1_MOLSC|nr:uncharacterized protein LY89DRAFT_118842 [Mollisia scopiformis]KUJ14666.1 hypothetical protein LY89DRAFT_118842 [Mollisia scopiformis]
MSSPGGQGQQGGAGSSNGGSSGGQGNQGNPTQATSTTAASSHGFATSTSSPSSTTQTSNPTSTSSSSSSNSNKTAVIGGVVGGIGGLLVLSLILIWFLNRRKKRQIAVKNGTVQPVTYAGLNSSFAGVHFAHGSNRSPHDSLMPAPLLLSSSTNSSHPDIEMRGGQSSPERHSATESDIFLPTYAESQAGMSMYGRSSLGRLNTSHTAPSTNVSPLSSVGTRDLHNFSPSDLPPIPPLPVNGRERDTMGFPIEPGMVTPPLESPGPASHGFETIHLEPEAPLPIISPRPRHPLVQQDSLERQVRQGMMPIDSPEPSQPINPNRLRVLSQEMPRESPILGLNSATIQPQAGPSNLNPNADINRMASQRTVSSMNSMPPVVSDAELESLGVGMRPAARR